LKEAIVVHEADGIDGEAIPPGNGHVATTVNNNYSERARFTGARQAHATRAQVPAIVLGGSQNALSVARNLARNGIEVVAVNYRYEAVRFSRYARYIHLDDGLSLDTWEGFLLGDASDHLRGSVLLACSDEAISIIIKHHAVLSRKFLLEETDPTLRRDLLDKFITYQKADEAGIPTVGYWFVRSREELERRMGEFIFPLIMKPLYSPQSQLLKSKAIFIPDRTTLAQRFDVATHLGIDIVLMEYIPGGDQKLCSYYTYLDEHGDPLVHFTKRTLRRFPPQQGEGTYHIVEWVPEAAELGLRFFRHLNFRGLGNIEFKRDERDGKLKIIEVNARFTASDCLIAKSGVNLALIAYNRITRRPQPPVLDYENSLVLCRPMRDALAAWELRRRGELRLSEWIGELRRINQFPFFELRDPLPALVVLGRRAGLLAARLLPPLATPRELRRFGAEG
jgi:D-aspartate ligase